MVTRMFKPEKPGEIFENGTKYAYFFLYPAASCPQAPFMDLPKD